MPSGTEYYNPITRYSVVITDGSKAMICSKSSMSPYRMNNLQFEKRLNETGSGSMDLLVNNEDNEPDLLASNSDIIIFDNAHPVYFGVITSVNNNNINPFNKTLTKSYYSIEFSEGCRKLSYHQCENSEVVTAPYDDIFNTITEVDGTNPYTGDVDNFINEYTFSVSNQDMLSQIDSLGEQCGARYRTNISKIASFDDAHYYSSQYIRRNDGYGVRVPLDSYVFCIGDNGLAIHKMRGEYTSLSYAFLETTELCKVGTIEAGDLMEIVIIKQNPIIDFKQTYYSDCVIPEDMSIPEYRYRNALAINRTCYDVDDDDSINKHYGKIVCTSPHVGNPNISASFKLVQPINESNQFARCAYVSYCTCPKIVDVIVESGGTIASIIVDDPDINKSGYGGYLYIPIREENSEVWEYVLVRNLSVWTNNYAYVENGITKYGTLMRYALELPHGNWNESTARGLIGLHLFGTKVKCISSGTSGFAVGSSDRANIGGFEYAIIDYDYYGGDEWTLYISPSSSLTKAEYPLSIPIGSLVFTTGTVYTNSPYSKYKDRCLSVTLQNNMDYHEVSLLASNIARYGSNFTKEVRGTCSIKVFKNRFTNTYPLPGEHVALYYDDGSSPRDKSKYYHNYELVSYTINTQTMTVDFVMGMQPLNVGDVIYRIKQNMTTNITS